MGGGALNRENLKQNGIRFHETVASHKDLLQTCRSPQIAFLRDGLLDFDGILSLASYNCLISEDQRRVNKDYQSARVAECEPRPKTHQKEHQKFQNRHQIHLHDSNFKRAVGIQKRARDIIVGAESRWVELLQKIFSKVTKSARTAEGIEYPRADQIVSRIRVESEQTWQRGRQALSRTLPSKAPPLTAAKVDRYLALPIHDRHRKSRGFHLDPFIQNFDLSMLAKLGEEGLICSPTVDLFKKTSPKDLICFPMAVIEMKHHEVKPAAAQFCYCQAANAAATCLAMLNQLSSQNAEGDRRTEIKPVVSFTFVGNRVKLWLANISSQRIVIQRGEKHQRCQYDMRCIWEGDLHNLWDTVQLCRIIDNVHYWAIHLFRPWVFYCLEQWRQAVLDGGSRSQRESDGTLEMEGYGSSIEQSEDERGQYGSGEYRGGGYGRGEHGRGEHRDGEYGSGEYRSGGYRGSEYEGGKHGRSEHGSGEEQSDEEQSDEEQSDEEQSDEEQLHRFSEKAIASPPRVNLYRAERSSLHTPRKIAIRRRSGLLTVSSASAQYLIPQAQGHRPRAHSDMGVKRPRDSALDEHIATMVHSLSFEELDCPTGWVRLGRDYRPGNF